MKPTSSSFALLALLGSIACASSPRREATSRVAGHVSAEVPAGEESAEPCATPQVKHARRAAPGERLTLGPGPGALSLAEGRWVVEVTVPPKRFVTLGVAGPRDALARFLVVGGPPLERLRAGARDDDGLLPSFVSFQSPDEPAAIHAVIDARHEVKLMLSTADAEALDAPHARDLKLGKASPRPLVGFPFPIEERAGYVMQAPHRYGFVRADVAAALRAAFEQTRIRYRRNAFALGDASQWDGARPASDLERPRHISHEGGRDVDVGLPTREDEPSFLERRCEGVLVEQTRLECAPGTVRGLDAERLAYFLGLLIDGPTPGGRHVPNASRRPGPIAVVETIFTDQAYIDEIRKVLPALRAKRWIHDEAFGALGEDGLLRHSPWHVDHVHIRFRGERAGVPELLRFEPEPPIRRDD